MPPLHEVQTSFRGALLDGDPAAALAVIQPDALAPEARLQIYRNHLFITLTDVLKAVFPVVCRLVDERFFGYACHTYIREQPPAAPCLFEYGASFRVSSAALRPARACPGCPTSRASNGRPTPRCTPTMPRALTRDNSPASHQSISAGSASSCTRRCACSHHPGLWTESGRRTRRVRGPTA